jgi:hypothetical protein
MLLARRCCDLFRPQPDATSAADAAAAAAQDSKIFSPANMRAAQDLAGYDGLIKEWMEKRYTLRYTGGLVSGGLETRSLCCILNENRVILIDNRLINYNYYSFSSSATPSATPAA